MLALLPLLYRRLTRPFNQNHLLLLSFLPPSLPPSLSYYECLAGGCKGLVMLALLPLLYRRLTRPFNDFAFVSIGFLLNMLYFLLLVLLPSPAAAFGTIPLNALSQAAYPHLRSLFSLSIAQNSQGQLFAALSAVRLSLLPSLSPSLPNPCVTTPPSL